VWCVVCDRFWVLLLLYVVVLSAVVVKGYVDNVYPLLSGPVARLEYALRSFNATEMRLWVEAAVDGLRGYHGNAVWLFPTPETDFDRIRSALARVAGDLRAVEALGPGSPEYHWAVRNAHAAIARVREALVRCAWARAVDNPVAYVLCALFLAALPGIFGLVEYACNRCSGW